MNVAAMFRHYVARPQEYLAITGLGIQDVELSKESYILWPFQKCTRIYVSPINYNFQIEDKCADNQPFILKLSFKMCPNVNDKVALLNYAKFVYPNEKISNTSRAYLRMKKIIIGEFRRVAASMTREELLKDTQVFEKPVNKIQLGFKQFGLAISDVLIKIEVSRKVSPLASKKVASYYESIEQIRRRTQQIRRRNQIGISCLLISC